MKKLMLAVGIAAATLLAGCTGTATDAMSISAAPPTLAWSSATPASSATPKPTPTPTPTYIGAVELTVEEAGERYLKYVCAASDEAFVEAIKAYDPYLASSQRPHPKTRQAAKKTAERYATSAKALADRQYVWPEFVRKDVATVAQGIYERAAWFTAITQLETWGTLDPVGGGGRLARAATAVRLALDLPPREQCPKEYRP